MTIYAPQNFAELEQVMVELVADKRAVNIQSGGTKTALGHETSAQDMLDVSHLSGVIDYEPEELIVTAHAGTPLSEIEGLLQEKGQMLAFEPPHFDRLYHKSSTGTIGGALMANLSGPRRLSAGAARDFLLGFQAVSGRGTSFRSGSKVVKNVTGYDLSKLLCGSFGTLAVLDEITLKTLPAPETSQTLVIAHPEWSQVAGAARAAMQTAYEASASAILPKGIHALSQNCAIAAIRIEGVAVSVADRIKHMQSELSSFGHADVISQDDSKALWANIRDVSTLLKPASQIWRMSLAPSASMDLVQELEAQLDCCYYADWAGGLMWFSVDDEHAHSIIRKALQNAGGGHATLMKADKALRAEVPVFEPLAPALAHLNQRVQHSFDPYQLLNPGRLG